MNQRDNALAQIVEIARLNELAAADIKRALADSANSPKPEAKSLVGRVLAYLGGIFVLAGISVFIAVNWSDMNTAARIIITLGSGIAVFFMALSAMGDERQQAIRTPLFLIVAAIGLNRKFISTKD